eukprot:c288_g1_i1.p1 GENE.c288_g1_i1~~c288_g1_i1.p1  ORF type:complete len:550 (+),score=143.59 c288_g1_i1:94-1743(+)
MASTAPAILGIGVGVREIGINAFDLPRWNTTTASTASTLEETTTPEKSQSPGDNTAQKQQQQPTNVVADLGPLGKENAQQQQQQSPSKFPFRPDLNEKVVLWQGNICKLKIDAIVNSSNETLSDRTGISKDIFALAGGQLEDEIKALEGCRTGVAKGTRAYNLPCERIIHTAAPHYNTRYRIAAEHALHMCYRNTLLEVVDNTLRSVALCSICTDKRGFPQHDATHIASRTVRRFLEQNSNSLDLVVICVDNDQEFLEYSHVLPLYFPRSSAEEIAAASKLPVDTGNEFGESVLEDRKIRIESLPGGLFNEAIATPTQVLLPIQDSFAAMKENPDDSRVVSAKSRAKHKEAEEKEITYLRYLQRARDENLSDIERLNLLHVGGSDESGRTIVTVIAGYLPAPSTPGLPSSLAALSEQQLVDRLLLFVIRELDQVVNKDYVLVYFQSDSDRHIGHSLIKKAFSVLTRKYRKNVKAVFVVHPTLWMKMLFWFMTPFVSKKFWAKLIYLDKLSELYKRVDPTLLNIPKFIQQYDAKTWGETSIPTGTADNKL